MYKIDLSWRKGFEDKAVDFITGNVAEGADFGLEPNILTLVILGLFGGLLLFVYLHFRKTRHLMEHIQDG